MIRSIWRWFAFFAMSAACGMFGFCVSRFLSGEVPWWMLALSIVAVLLIVPGFTSATLDRLEASHAKA